MKQILVSRHSRGLCLDNATIKIAFFQNIYSVWEKISLDSKMISVDTNQLLIRKVGRLYLSPTQKSAPPQLLISPLLKIGQFVPIYQGDYWLRRLRIANEEHTQT